MARLDSRASNAAQNGCCAGRRGVPGKGAIDSRPARATASSRWPNLLRGAQPTLTARTAQCARDPLHAGGTRSPRSRGRTPRPTGRSRASTPRPRAAWSPPPSPRPARSRRRRIRDHLTEKRVATCPCRAEKGVAQDSEDGRRPPHRMNQLPGCVVESWYDDAGTRASHRGEQLRDAPGAEPDVRIEHEHGRVRGRRRYRSVDTGGVPPVASHGDQRRVGRTAAQDVHGVVDRRVVRDHEVPRHLAHAGANDATSPSMTSALL